MFQRLRNKKRQLFNNNQGSLTFGIAFFFLAVVLMFFFVFATPMLMNFTASIYSSAEYILEDTEEVIANIQNASIKSELQGAIQSAQDTTTDNVNLLSYYIPVFANLHIRINRTVP